MIEHVIKVSRSAFSRLKDGVKTYELVNGDRDLQSGDRVFLCEYDPTILNDKNFLSAEEKKRRGEPRGYTGKRLSAMVGTLETLNNWTVVSLLAVVQVDDINPEELEGA